MAAHPARHQRMARGNAPLQLPVQPGFRAATLEPAQRTATDRDRTLGGQLTLGRGADAQHQVEFAAHDVALDDFRHRPQRLQDFGADSLNDALRLATGIQVEQTSTNQTQFLARGFEIKSTQVDGVGMPNDWGIATGAMDEVLADHKDVAETIDHQAGQQAPRLGLVL